MLHAQTSRSFTSGARARGMGLRSLRYSLSPMQQAVNKGEANPTAGQRLTVAQVIDWLIEDKLAEPQAGEKLKKERRYYRGTMHPLVIVAEQKWKNGAKLLTLDALTEWLAKRFGMEYLHIDPLKIDFAGVTEMM